MSYQSPAYYESIEGRAAKALDLIINKGFGLCDDFHKSEQTEDGLGPVSKTEVCYWKDGAPAMFVDPITPTILRYLLDNKLVTIRVGPYPNNDHQLMQHFEPTERGRDWLSRQARIIDDE